MVDRLNLSHHGAHRLQHYPLHVHSFPTPLLQNYILKNAIYYAAADDDKATTELMLLLLLLLMLLLLSACFNYNSLGLRDVHHPLPFFKRPEKG